jgi:hypothetical protein
VLYTVSRALVEKYRKLRFSAPHETKTPKPIDAKFCTTDYHNENTTHKVHNYRQGGRGCSYGWSCWLLGVNFMVFCWACAQPTPSVELNILCINQRGWGYGCAFCGSHWYISPLGELPSKPLGTRKGISSVPEFASLTRYCYVIKRFVNQLFRLASISSFSFTVISTCLVHALFTCLTRDRLDKLKTGSGDRCVSLVHRATFSQLTSGLVFRVRGQRVEILRRRLARPSLAG